MESVTTPKGTTTYAYDNRRRRTSTTLPDPDGSGGQPAPVTSTTYDAAGNVLTETDALGYVTEYEYDALNRVIRTTRGIPPVIDFDDYTVSDYGNPAKTSAGSSYTIEDDGATFNLQGDIWRHIDFGYTVTDDTILEFDYESDTEGDLQGIGFYSGTQVSSTRFFQLYGTNSWGISSFNDYDPGVSTVKHYKIRVGDFFTGTFDYLLFVNDDNSVPKDAESIFSNVKVYEENSTLTEYDDFGQMVTMTDPNGNETTYEYDDLGRRTKIVSADPDGAGALSSPEVSYVYDAAGQMTEMTDEIGGTTTYEYDNLGRQVSVTMPDPDGAGSLTAPVTTYSYDAASQLLSMTDPLGNTTSYTYDDMGRRLTETLPDPDGAGGLSAPVTMYTYNVNGQLASVTDAESQTVSYTYNAAGLTYTMTDPRGITTYTYDNLGRQSTITEPDPDGGGPLSAPTTSYEYDNEGDMVTMTTLDGDTTYEYDDLGRITKVTQPDPDGAGSEVSAWTTYTYDAVGRQLSETDRLGHATSFAFDGLGRLTKKTNAEGGETTYTYDANGNRLTLTDPEDNTTTWTYDALNRMVTNTNELGKTRNYRYDAAGNLTHYTDRNDRVVRYTYDNLQRLTQERWWNGSSYDRYLNYTYDVASRLTEASDPAATFTFTYDDLGRNTSTEHDLAALGIDVVVDEAYDALGRRTSLAAEIDGTDDLVNSYAYDYLNRMTQVTQGSQSGGNTVAEKRANFSYDAEDKGKFTSITRYADLAGTDLVATSTYDYDAADRITALTHEDGSSSTLAGYTWSYDEGNRLTAFTVYGYSAEDATYSYDDESYTYDENGNRTNTGYSTGDNNQLLSDGTYNYTYDDEGNRLTKTNISTGEVIEYTWDYRNRLTNITTKNSSDVVTHEVDYTYDVFNRRIVKTIDADGAGAGDGNRRSLHLRRATRRTRCRRGSYAAAVRRSG